MKKFKIVSIVLLGLLVIIIVLALPKNSVQAVKSTKDHDFKTENLVAELKDKGINLYYVEKSDPDMFKGFYLKYNNSVKYFDWESVDKTGFYPTISLIEDKYIAIICTLGEGSGLNKQQMHLVNIDSLEEVKYQDPLDIIRKQAATKIEIPNVYIKINNVEWRESNLNLKNSSNYFETVSYENIITYEIRDNSFAVIAKAQVSPSLFIGEFVVVYIF
ncbi:hypothetical protein [Lacrimispora xylanisolvens]|uniref:hypothetical protein n=1 Tax=Lacrimispora xylanisolvens TaxID=384636 RepID=UPI002402B22D